VVTAAVPWARPGSRFTRSFEETCAWLATHAAFTMVAVLRKIGIDEIAYRKSHRYLLAVTDHETGRLAWAAEGRNAATLRAFFDALDALRRRLAAQFRSSGRKGQAATIKDTRWAPIKNPEDLTAQGSGVL
jgi:transposase